MATLSEARRQQVFGRAHHRCEYCQTSRRLIGMPLIIDHIVPLALAGGHEPENLCAACYRCNEYKGAKTHDVDPVTNKLVPLFSPRTMVWAEHFQWENGGLYLVGNTPVGRATVLALRLNNEYLVESRSLWVASGWHPPPETPAEQRR